MNKNDKESTVNLTISMLSIIVILASILQLGLVVLYVVDLINVINLGQNIDIIHIVANIGIKFITAVLEFSMGIFGLKGIKDRKILKKSRTCAVVCFSFILVEVLLNVYNGEFKLTMISELMFPLAFLMVTFGKNMEEAMSKTMDKAMELKKNSEKKKKDNK